MEGNKFLTPEEVFDRYRGVVSLSTLENWRSLKIGPRYIKIGKAVLYPVEELEAWDNHNIVECRKSRMIGRSRRTEE
jgi:hypothetical protein